MKKFLTLLFTVLCLASFAQTTIRMSATATGTNTYVTTFNPTVSVFNQNTLYVIPFTNANSSGTVTIDPDDAGGGSAISIKGSDGNDLDVGAIVAGGTYYFKFNGTLLRMLGAWEQDAGGSSITPAALTKTDDTNVTLTLGGTPATALLQATSLTLGWTGTLSGTRGGTGVNNGSNTITLAGNLVTSGANSLTLTTTGTTNVTLPTTGTLATRAGTETLTNKRWTPRVQSVSSSATVTPNADDDDAVKITAQAAGLTLANPSGTPTTMQAMVIRIKDNGTARAITYGSQYRAIGIVLPTTTVISKTLYLGMVYNDADTKWDVVGYSLEP